MFSDIKGVSPGSKLCSIFLTLSPPQSHKCDTEKNVVPAETPPFKGGVWAGTLLFSDVLFNVWP